MRCNSRRMKWVAIALAVSASCAVLPVQAQEKPKPTPERGEALATKLCANCHVLPGGNPAAVPAGIPTFRAIANKPGQSGDHIAQVLMLPHAPMPDLQVTRDEILDILAYLESIRTDQSVQPIAPPADIAPQPTPRKS